MASIELLTTHLDELRAQIDRQLHALTMVQRAVTELPLLPKPTWMGHTARIHADLHDIDVVSRLMSETISRARQSLEEISE